MSGVIDEDGTQWEHCNVCGEFVRIDDLLYDEPSEKHPHGVDLCSTCDSLDEQTRDEIRERAQAKWLAKNLAHYAKIGWEVEVTDDGGIRILSTGRS